MVVVMEGRERGSGGSDGREVSALLWSFIV